MIRPLVFSGSLGRVLLPARNDGTMLVRFAHQIDAPDNGLETAQNVR